MKKHSVSKLGLNPRKIVSVVFMYALCIGLSISLAFGTCYAYFSAKVDGEGTVTAGILTLQYRNELNTAESVNLIVYNTRDSSTNLIDATAGAGSVVMPGDTLQVRGGIKNTGDINCYVLLKLEVEKNYQSTSGNVPYKDTLWYTLGGTRVVSNGDGRYVQGATLLTPNTVKNINVGYVLDGNEVSNSYSGKQVNVTLTIKGFQATSVERETYIATTSHYVYASDAIQATHSIIGKEIDVWSDDEVTPASLTGSGTQVSPYLISTVGDLLRFKNSYTGSTYSGKYFKLTKNLDLNNRNWTPMINFYGILDGDGHCIYNLSISSTSGEVGLFGSTCNATIRNIGIVNYYITLTGSSTIQCGALIGVLYGSKDSNPVNGNPSIIENCFVIGRSFATNTDVFDITANTHGTDLRLGSIIGATRGDNTTNISIIVRNCYAMGNVYAKPVDNTRNSFVGGFIGCPYPQKLFVENSYYIGKIEFYSANTGIMNLFVGNSQSLEVSNSFGVYSDTKLYTKDSGSGWALYSTHRFVNSSLVENCAYIDGTATSFTKVGTNQTSNTFSKTTIGDIGLLREFMGWSVENWIKDDGTNWGYPMLRVFNK